MGSVHDSDCGKRVDWMHRYPLCDDCLTKEEKEMKTLVRNSNIKVIIFLAT